jgi:hypothetical protein
MKICIVIQSDAFRTSAGMRIRYDRFAQCLPDPAVTLEAVSCATLVAAQELEHDVYIFCKTFDTSALLLARRARSKGKAVGHDVFDDYFSQYDDPRLQTYRDWMRQMAPVTDFAICTTARMVEVLRDYLPDVPITAIDDPLLGFDPIAAGSLADAKVERARANRVLEVAWFGIGDNPYFLVGLADLASCDPALARMGRLGWTVHLTIVTNRRAFEGAAAEALRGLSVGFELLEWTEEVERQVLEKATVALLPVSGQSFSRAKSLNRPLTAISSGCQVLSIGYPLYERLDEFVYRSADELLHDIERGHCRIGSASRKALIPRIAEVANAFDGAKRFVQQAREGLRRASARRGAHAVVCLIHGRKTKIDLHKMVQRIGGLSVKTIFTDAPWNFPIRFDLVDGAIRMRATTGVARKFELPVSSTEGSTRIGDFDFIDVDLAALGLEPLRVNFNPTSVFEDAILYADVFAFAENCCAAAFGTVDVITCDISPVVVARPRRPLPIHRTGKSVDVAVLAEERRREPFRPWSGLIEKMRLRVSAPKSAEMEEAVSLFEDCALFDRNWYLENYADVAASRLDPLRHYLELGWREGRDPSPAFSSKLYLKDNPDVAQQELNPLLHYIKFGQFEGRKVRPRIRSGSADR